MNFLKEFLVASAFLEPESWKRYEEQLSRFTKQGWVVTGYHGTSAKIANIIQAEGLRPYTCGEGKFGIWFNEAGWKNNSHYVGIRKSRKQKDPEYAVIEALVWNPIPDDPCLARPQFRVTDVGNIKVVSIEYYPVPNIISER